MEGFALEVCFLNPPPHCVFFFATMGKTELWGVWCWSDLRSPRLDSAYELFAKSINAPQLNGNLWILKGNSRHAILNCVSYFFRFKRCNFER